MTRFLDFIIQARCRIVHGHVMVCFGADTEGAWYMCARCLKCERLHILTGTEREL
jgi:hypothetical protein